MQQQQQPAEYDLLAVFTDENTANAAAAKLQKEGFGENEVFQLSSGTVGSGQFREHGPNQNRRDIFLETKRSGPNPMVVLLLIVVVALLFVLGVFLLDFAVHWAQPASELEGGGVGAVIGAIIGLFQRGRVLGAIGQDLSKGNAASSKPTQGAKTIIALRFPDAENISRKSRARAILITNGGKIDRSVGRRDE